MSRPPQEEKFGPVGAFDPKLFRQAIQSLGLRFRWSRAVECPCRLEGTDQWDPSCASCGGDGWTYVSPESDLERHKPASENWIEVACTFAQATAKPTLYEPFGGWTSADALMTYQGAMRVSYRDRFVGFEQLMGWTELLVATGPGTTVKVGKTGRTTGAQKSAMRYEPVIVNYIADEDDVRYYKGTHWRVLDGTLVEPQRVKWLAGQGPATGKLFTVHYDCRPVWIVDEATHTIQTLRGPENGLKGEFEPRNLPNTFKVKLDYLTTASGS